MLVMLFSKCVCRIHTTFKTNFCNILLSYNLVMHPIFTTSHFQGCSDALIDFAEEHFIYLVAVAGGVALIQLIGMILSCCLCCTLRKIDDFKA